MGNSASSSIPLGSVLRLDDIEVRVKSLLGTGAFGEVFKCTDSGGATLVLKRMKIPLDNEEGTLLASRELALLSSLPASPYLVGALRTNESEETSREGQIFRCYDILMNFYSAGSLFDDLSARHKARIPYTEAEILHIFDGLSQAITLLHNNKGLAHWDIKPENLLMREGDLSVALCDFGSCSRDTVVDSTRISALEDKVDKTTTLAYRSPEHCDLRSVRSVGRPADIWAIGILLYKLAYFKTPFEDSSGVVSKMGILSSTLVFPPPSSSSSSYSSGFQALIKAALIRDPIKRPTIGELTSIAKALPTWATAPSHPVAVYSSPSSLPKVPLRPMGGSREGGVTVSTPPNPGTHRTLEVAHERLLQLMGKKEERWVLKATSSGEGEGAPKAKYYRKLVVRLWEESGRGAAKTVFTLLSSRLSAVVKGGGDLGSGVKCVILVLRLLQGGPPLHTLVPCQEALSTPLSALRGVGAARRGDLPSFCGLLADLAYSKLAVFNGGGGVLLHAGSRYGIDEVEGVMRQEGGGEPGSGSFPPSPALLRNSTDSSNNLRVYWEGEGGQMQRGCARALLGLLGKAVGLGEEVERVESTPFIGAVPMLVEECWLLLQAIVLLLAVSDNKEGSGGKGRGGGGGAEGEEERRCNDLIPPLLRFFAFASRLTTRPSTAIAMQSQFYVPPPPAPDHPLPFTTKTGCDLAFVNSMGLFGGERGREGGGGGGGDGGGREGEEREGDEDEDEVEDEVGEEANTKAVVGKKKEDRDDILWGGV